MQSDEMEKWKTLRALVGSYFAWSISFLLATGVALARAEAAPECEPGEIRELHVWVSNPPRYAEYCNTGTQTERQITQGTLEHSSGDTLRVEPDSQPEQLIVYSTNGTWLPAGSNLEYALARWPSGWGNATGPATGSSVWLRDPRVPLEYTAEGREIARQRYLEQRRSELQLEAAQDAWILMEATASERGRITILESVNGPGAAITLTSAPNLWLTQELYEIDMQANPQRRPGEQSNFVTA